MITVGDEELAVGMTDIAGQLLAPARRVDTDQCRPGHRRGTTEKEVLGNVVEQHSDVKGPGDPEIFQHGGPATPLLDDLGPTPAAPLEDQAGMAVVSPGGHRSATVRG